MWHALRDGADRRVSPASRITHWHVSWTSGQLESEDRGNRSAGVEDACGGGVTWLVGGDKGCWGARRPGDTRGGWLVGCRPPPWNLLCPMNQSTDQSRGRMATAYADGVHQADRSPTTDPLTRHLGTGLTHATHSTLQV